jgi:hypothetical protein
MSKGITKGLLLLVCCASSMLFSMEPGMRGNKNPWAVEVSKIGSGQMAGQWRVRVRDKNTMVVVADEYFDERVILTRWNENYPNVLNVSLIPKGSAAGQANEKIVQINLPNPDSDMVEDI